MYPGTSCLRWSRKESAEIGKKFREFLLLIGGNKWCEG